MSKPAPWTDPAWQRTAQERLDEALLVLGRPRTGPVETVKTWGRSCVQVAPTEAGKLWIKHGYGLPPGEEQVLERLGKRWPGRVPAVVATWSGAVAMEPLRGTELDPSGPLEDWLAAARVLGELAAGEARHAREWLELGVRDRRPSRWAASVEALAESPVVRASDAEILRGFEAMLPDFVSRYLEAFTTPATLVHQDSGCCNIHVGEGGPLIFDWADVVIGHPTFSCDRLLDQATPERREPIIRAFCEPLGLEREVFSAMRRSNVLHEILRYHDELAYLAPDDPTREALGDSVRSQLRVLVEHERARG